LAEREKTRGQRAIGLDGKTVVIVGGLDAMPRRVAADELARRGAVTRRGLTRATDLLVVGHQARARLAGGRLQETLEKADRLRVRVISERTLLRALGLLRTSAEPAAVTLEELTRRARLAPEIVRLLTLFDLIETDGDRCSFRALVTAREVARLLDEGLALTSILESVGLIGVRGDTPGDHPLARHKLICDPDGKVAVRFAGGFAELDGQMRLPLPQAGNLTVDSLFEAAEEAEESKDWATAEHFYRRCTQIDRDDPIAPFNLANVLREQGRTSEAKCHLHQALAIDPNFAEAWYNLAGVVDGEGKREVARSYLLRAVAADPWYGDPMYNLAYWHFVAGRFDEAGAWWRRYLDLDPDSAWAAKARKGLLLCARHLKEVT
jgi:tetratricopeptide (TPR) repeat protein